MCSNAGELVNYDLMLESITENMYEFMKCSYCKELCHPPFKQTLLGKLVCGLCMRRYGKNLRRDGVLSTARLFIVERLYLLLVFSCKYYHQGCEFRGTGAELEEHHKFCEFVSIECPHDCCWWEGKPTELFEHYSVFHAPFVRLLYSRQEKIVHSTVIGDCLDERNIIFAFGKVFCFNFFRDPGNQSFHFTATNMVPLDTEDYEMIVDFRHECGWKTIYTIDFTQSTNTMRETINYWPRRKLAYDETSSNYNIIIMEKKSSSGYPPFYKFLFACFAIPAVFRIANMLCKNL
ncbi:hypothetical protein WA026_009257 [Henosepilachna vigintioctopunctata]|uniref:SIAH-type domain-containing protein n=1 Tax=Henosepilachna vigintioctopunctata TaxID=420089 RepID=A0AAW1UYE5_9CUCU